MKTWIVTEIAEVHRYYRVEAETAGDAELMVLADEVLPSDESVMSSHVNTVIEAPSPTWIEREDASTILREALKS